MSDCRIVWRRPIQKRSRPRVPQQLIGTLSAAAATANHRVQTVSFLLRSRVCVISNRRFFFFDLLMNAPSCATALAWLLKKVLLRYVSLAYRLDSF